MSSLCPADILLPMNTINMKKWAVIACDQFTSQQEYWDSVRECVGDEPSMLHVIYPEVYLERDDKEQHESRIRDIRREMNRYLAEGILRESVHRGYILTVRTTDAGVRLGLLAALDLESYDYRSDAKAPVRATERTVESRIPTRVGIRESAPLESPHVMLLVDDQEQRLLEPLYERRDRFRKLYDTDLMLEGGRVSGYAIDGEDAGMLTRQLAELEREALGVEDDGIFLAVGDGNHSLAAAKACWEAKKVNLDHEDLQSHPARYALVEIVNLYDPSLIFAPIHRVLFGDGESSAVQMSRVAASFKEYLNGRGYDSASAGGTEKSADVIFLQGEREVAYELGACGGRLPVDLLQSFLDEYICLHPELSLDYVHSKDAVRKLVSRGDACGMLLKPIGKKTLFPAIRAGGVLPRKTFSIGEEHQKRYYMECRKLTRA